MSELSNGDRAARGELALNQYGITIAPHNEGFGTLATDLVADLMHALERLGFDPWYAVQRGMGHYDAERRAELVGTTSTGSGD